MGNSTNRPDTAANAEKPANWPKLPWLIGHRGAAGLVPENTLPSFERAFTLGVQAVELDLYLIEGELVVFHDDDLQRTTNGTGPIAGQPLAALRQLDAGEGAQIPLLREVLDILPSQTAINIELKGPGCAPALFELLQNYPTLNPLISSFRSAELKAYRALDSAVRIGVLRHRWPPAPWRSARELKPWSINLNVAITTAKRVAKIHESGYCCLVYTVNDVDQAKSLLAMGVDGLFTDRPDLLRVLF